MSQVQQETARRNSIIDHLTGVIRGAFPLSAGGMGGWGDGDLTVGVAWTMADYPKHPHLKSRPLHVRVLRDALVLYLALDPITRESIDQRISEQLREKAKSFNPDHDGSMPFELMKLEVWVIEAGHIVPRAAR